MLRVQSLEAFFLSYFTSFVVKFLFLNKNKRMQDLKHILLITYYWPPAGGAGVHRWLRFSKFFKENGWQMHVYTPENAHYPIIDEELNSEIENTLIQVKHPIFEPQQLLAKKAGFGKASGVNTTKKKSAIQSAMIWVRGNLFIPDARLFWIRPSVKKLTAYLKEHPEITHIISTGPPHSVHVIARNLKRKMPTLNWMADFRDPWTQIDFYADLLPSKWADNKQKSLEKSVLKEANQVITVSNDCAQGLEEIGNRSVHIITNGFIFPEFNPKERILSEKFTIAHFGSMAESRNPIVLWKALHELVLENSNFAAHLQIELYGNVDLSILKSIDEYALGDYFEGVKTVKHSESIALQQSRSILLLIANNTPNVKGILTGKFFEYLGAKRPVLAIGAIDSDLNDTLKLTNGGHLIAFEDVAGMKRQLLDYFDAYLHKELYVDLKNLSAYNSRNITQKIIDLL